MMERLRTEFQVNLAVSLHATTDELRDRLAPINRRYPLAMLLDACKPLPLARRRRIMFEDVMLGGINDSAEHPRRVAKMLLPFRPKFHFLLFHPFHSPP